MFLFPTSTSEIFNLINDLECSKGSGADNISAELLKRNIHIFKYLLSEIFNQVISSGIYPDCLKLAKVVPVFKGGDKLDINNYRPISVLSVFDKVLEKVLNNRINNFLISHNFFYRFQYGFRSGVGTEIALIETIDMINQTFNESSYMGALFLDLRKAFDCIDHEILLGKLFQYGFRGPSFDLLKSYLTNRVQYVTIDGKSSNIQRITTGVPQGSVLGPTLFLIFINDIHKLNLNGRIRLFADDTTLFYNTSNIDDIPSMVQSDLTILQEYFNSNMLSINLSKTKFMIFKSAQKSVNVDINISICNVKIEIVESYKYLGIILDSNLTWQHHIDYIRKKVAPLVGFLRKLAYYVPSAILRNIYFAFIPFYFYVRNRYVWIIS